MRALLRSSVPTDAVTVEPVQAPFPKIKGADIAADFLGNRVAGDFYDSFRVSPERVLFGLLDVAGRREDNLAIFGAAQQIFHDFGTELFSRPDINESEAMTELSLSLNRTLIDTSHGVHPCPAFIGCYHEKFGTLCYTNAGHTPGLLRDSKGIVELTPTGLPLGLFSHATSDAPTVGLEKDAVLLLVSRGVVEGKYKDDKAEDAEFGLERVRDRLQADSSSNAQAVSASILNTVGESTCEPL